MAVCEAGILNRGVAQHRSYSASFIQCRGSYRVEKIVEEAFDRMCILPLLDLTPVGGRRQQPKLRVSKASKKQIPPLRRISKWEEQKVRQ